MSPKAPAPRGFTIAERRSVTFESKTLWIVMGVALIAAVLSFFALQWVGSQFMDWRLAFGLPLAIDGFAIACSLGVVRSTASGEPLRERVSEWAGIGLALGLSVLGNVFHGLHTVTDAVPRELVVAYSAAIPVVVAYGIHVYGRAMTKGISANVLADDPDQLQFGLVHLGDETAATRSAPVKVRPRTTAPAPAPRTEPAMAAAVAAANSRNTENATSRTAAAAVTEARTADTDRAALRAEYAERLAAGDRMQGGEIADRLGVDKGRARNIRLAWDRELQAAGGQRPELDLDAERADRAEQVSQAS